ncbi:hypothetical protein ACNH6C_07590 [Bdellovibrio bacteriovorus]|uniref:hypothetical protein n=1 Tax=Bdellovibrio bacteriovorus TaxID=959 RepID=UPI003A7FE7C5
MSNKSQYAKAFTALLALAIFATGCTKKRDAALPEEAQENIFAISDIPELQTENSQYEVQTDDSLSTLSLGDSSKATAEKGVVAVRDSQVPKRLKYMFKGLEMSGQAGQKYSITFSVDKQFVTAYKIVTDTSELSNLEKHLAQVKEEVQLQKQLQKSKDNSKAKSMVASLKKIRSEKQALLSQKSATLLVPLFKFKINGYGVLQRVKNQLNEETSTLRMKTTDWADATHIQVSINPADRMPVGIDAASRGDLDRTFVMNKINNKLMTAGTLNSDYQIPVNLEKDTRILTLLDVDALHVFEVGQVGKTVLTDSQLAQLKSGAKDSNVRQCTEEIVKALPAEAQQNCILVLRYDVPVTYVRPELPVVDYEGNQDATISFKEVRAGDSVGLVQIAQNVQAKKVEANTQFDPRTTIKIADVKGKEFFYKRTIEDVAFSAASPGLAAGMAGSLTIVKFDLEESRVVVRKADLIANYKSGTNAVDYEELMSLPVKYLKLEEKDATGAKYAMARLVETSRKDADYMELDWTKNSLPQDKSPYAAIYEGCLTGIADAQVMDVNMKLDQGVLSFTQQYSTGLRWGCIGDFQAFDDYNGTPGYQAAVRVKERVSFKLNDGSTDKAFVESIPFSAQNALGYGVWTIGQANPDKNNLRGREGTEKSLPMVHDFRNGKKLVYTVTGLPTDNPEMRKLYIESTEELVKAWNFAYKQAFKGSALERSGDYIEMQIAGENGVEAHLGDLDKNIIHFENKPADHGILGVSQVGFNPRSAIVVADSLILYAGNMLQSVGADFRNMKIKQDWDKMKESFREQARAQLAKQQAEEAEAAKKAQTQQGTAQDKAVAATQFTRNMVNMVKGAQTDAKSKMKAKNIGASMNILKAAVAERKSLGGDSNFKFSSPQTQDAWMNKVHKALSEKPGMTPREIETVMAREMLAAKGSKLSAKEKATLAKTVKMGEIHAKMMATMQNAPGCMKTSAELADSSFIAMPFNQALKIEIINTLGHEMGHSQGLTHNFIGSFDKANFANEDGTESKRNYSSIMDYLTPGKFNWDGLGTYDIRALRASHLGLVEATPEMIAKLEGNAASKKLLVNGKYLHVNTIKANFAKNGWANFNKYQVQGVVKEYMYCTDKDVGYEPTCERHDFGTSAQEIVESNINDWESMYVNSFHSWDRLVFDVGTSIRASSMSSYYQFRMRKFMDELFYMLVVDNRNPAIQDYVQASLKTYLFYTQLINTPDANSLFQSADRFIAVPYEKKEVNEKGEETGKTSMDVAIVEKRAIQDISVTKDRLDTVGLEYEKITAMEMLTMKGYPSYKYYYNSIQFSFLDFEKYILGMSPENSLFVNTITGMMLDQLQPTFSNEDVTLQPIQGEKATVTASMRFYAGIYGILNLEASTLRDKDNFATLFKVGSSLGKAPSDRTALSQLGVSEKSKTRLSFWALDNALASQTLVDVAAQKNFFIQNAEVLNPLMQKMAVLQLQNLLTQGQMEAKLTEAKTALTAKLNELNKDGKIVSAEMVKANPNLSIEKQVELMTQLNEQVISISVAVLTKQQGAQEAAQELAAQTAQLAEVLPLLALDFNALNEAMKTAGEALSKQQGLEVLAQLGDVSSQLVDGGGLEVSYGIIMKNLEFLNKLTLMTNPEYNR